MKLLISSKLEEWVVDERASGVLEDLDLDAGEHVSPLSLQMLASSRSKSDSRKENKKSTGKSTLKTTIYEIQTERRISSDEEFENILQSIRQYAQEALRESGPTKKKNITPDDDRQEPAESPTCGFTAAAEYREQETGLLHYSTVPYNPKKYLSELNAAKRAPPNLFPRWNQIIHDSYAYFKKYPAKWAELPDYFLEHEECDDDVWRDKWVEKKPPRSTPFTTACPAGPSTLWHSLAVTAPTAPSLAENFALIAPSISPTTESQPFSIAW